MKINLSEHAKIRIKERHSKSINECKDEFKEIIKLIKKKKLRPKPAQKEGFKGRQYKVIYNQQIFVYYKSEGKYVLITYYKAKPYTY